MLRAGGLAGIGGLLTTRPAPAPADPAAGAPGVFAHGVASGDPLPDAVLLWTRVTSHPGDVPGAGAGRPVPLRWEVAADAAFTRVLAAGTAVSDPEADNTVKVDATGLPADAALHYRFTVAAGEHAGQSITGRTRTAPAAGAPAGRLVIGLTSCANWESGYFAAYRDMAADEDIDVIMCVGDYIYEYGAGEYAGKLGPLREHRPAHEIRTLADYRLRYGTYRTDPDLRAAHAAKPWIVTWDDHETANDSWSGGAENHDDAAEGDWAARRDAAMRAYLEWLPVRATAPAAGGHLYRTLSWGDLAELVMLDLRSYRDRPLEFRAVGGIDDSGRTMLGSAQFRFLADRWRSSTARWNLVGNSVMFTPVLIPPMPPRAGAAVAELLGLPEQGLPYNLDQWDGYAAERRRVIGLLDAEGIDNVVFLTGDIHSSWACDVPREPGDYPGAGVVAAEIVCTSVSSPNIDDIVGLPQRNPISRAAETALTGANRHCRYLEFDHHGYARVTVAPDAILAEYRFVDDKANPAARVFTHRRFRIRRGAPIMAVD
ncbi:alkaline phosphatase [Corynebacterium sphenisci DSM 44792]|uniref:Alkaline phosphatase n=1 Tax=Corynebacterium sphenisci DSM 44792 TaxID=1437874 RepID=A0A1L7D0I3_9CORY|nr:alkaline phosphatase [Corynebacterium sphenisci DSM 44792]